MDYLCVCAVKQAAVGFLTLSNSLKITLKSLFPYIKHPVKGKQTTLPMVAECDCQEGGRWNILYYPSADLCFVRIKL